MSVNIYLPSEFTAHADLGSPAPSVLATQGVDAQLVIPSQLHASLWWRTVPLVNGEKLGVIGHFRAAPTADISSVTALLDAACRTLKDAGCTLAVGPMDGNTWRSYRFLTWRGDEPRFAFEPDQADVWPTWWQQSGFNAYEQYWSAVVTQLDAHDVRLDAAIQRLTRAGVTIREIDLAVFEADLTHIYAVSEIAFRDNVLYTPLAQAEFLAMYRQVQPLLRPGLSFIAERAGKPIGFVFALPDLEQTKRGVPIDTVVVKTLAVLPGRELAGLGKVLLERCQHAAFAAGFRRAIHALMHAGNASRNLGDDAREIRRYTLFARRLL